MPSFATSYCSAPCRCWVPTVSAVTSRRSPTSYKVSPSPSRTFANCSKNLIQNIPLCRILRELTDLKQFTDDLQKRRLVVKVTSFAYKKGIPEDSTGNGGGFVFDCRAVNNPGKYERYKPFTGLDEPVIRFLEDDGEIAVFLEHAYALVDASVKRYMERGFTNLSVCFGCTGGQHRSVYSAQHLAEHLHKKFGVQVNLIHREQNIEQTFKAKV